MSRVKLEKTIEDKHWIIDAEVEYDNQIGWHIKNLLSINGKKPRGYVLVDRFSSNEIQNQLNKQN